MTRPAYTRVIVDSDILLSHFFWVQTFFRLRRLPVLRDVINMPASLEIMIFILIFQKYPQHPAKYAIAVLKPVSIE